MVGQVSRGGGLGRAIVLTALALNLAACSVQQGQAPVPSPSPSESPSPLASPLALSILSANFHKGEVGVAYAPVTLNATGGVTPYTWTVSSGALPAGLTISSNGTVSGKPAKAGTFHPTLQVADAAGRIARVPRSVAIAGALKASLVSMCAVQCLVEVGCVNVCGKFGNLSGGVAPYKYSSVGATPTGVHLSGLSLAGTFGAGPRYWQFTVYVTDAFGVSTSISPTFNVFPHLTFSGGSCTSTLAPGTCTTNLSFTVGVSETPAVRVVTWTGGKTCGPATAPTICPAPPFHTTVQGNQVTINLGPTSVYSTGKFTLSLSDQFLCGPGVHCSVSATLTVNLA